MNKTLHERAKAARAATRRPLPCGDENLCRRVCGKEWDSAKLRTHPKEIPELLAEGSPLYRAIVFFGGGALGIFLWVVQLPVWVALVALSVLACIYFCLHSDS